MIAVSATHRREAIEATSFAIDAVKSSTTIWKKVSPGKKGETLNERESVSLLSMYMYILTSHP